jgi:hypothetical protein
LSTTVWPSSTTLLPDSTSDWVIRLPIAADHERMGKYSGETPLIEVAQFWSSLITCWVVRSWGLA